MIRELIEDLREVELRPVDADSLSGIWPEIVQIIQNPGSNLIGAVLILLIVSLFLLIITLAVIAFIAGRDDEDVPGASVGAYEDAQGEAGPVAAAPRRRDPAAWSRTILQGFGVLLLLLAVTSLSSQSRTVCMSCHAGTAHTDEVVGDVHQTVTCVSCHEYGGVVESLTFGVWLRMQHIVGGMTVAEPAGTYGAVTGQACLSCHRGVREGVTDNPDRALQMSHKEPLEAGAGCMDCHILDETQRIGRRTVGMSTCLRCHDEQQASAECPTCHTGDVSQAVLASRVHEPRETISQPDCYTCHDPGPCDSCHGVRLPHPERYDLTHMMDAARDIWFGGGQTCTECHTSERNSCYQRGCHVNELDYHRAEDPGFPRNHGSRPDMSCDDCHPFAGQFDDPCRMCHSESR